MDIEILVYDNQQGYYDLLRAEISGFVFTLYKSGNKNNVSKYDVVIFFLSDELELIDLAKLYDGNVPFILASTKIKEDVLIEKENLYGADLILTKDALVLQLTHLLKGIEARINLKEKAL